MNFTAQRVLMVRPLTFCSNPETFDSNAFQTRENNLTLAEVLEKSRAEFDAFQKVLTDAGIGITKFSELEGAKTPDALFPNNWFVHLPDGRVFLMPMFAPNRRREYRADAIMSLTGKEIIDLRPLADDGIFLEGTGSLIFDHEHRTGWACLSVRSFQEAIDIFAQKSGYKIITFNSVDENGMPVYHTNVVMALSPKNAVINLESVRDPAEKEKLVQSLKETGHEIIDISHEQTKNFCGNLLFLQNQKGENFWVGSEKARRALKPEQLAKLEREGRFLSADLNTIETYGGGGARCLMGEVYI